MNLTTLFEEAIDRNASDIHLATGETPCIRIAGDLVRLSHPALDRASINSLLETALPTDARIRVESGLPVERTVLFGDSAFTGIVFRFGDDGLAATFRRLAGAIPSLEQVGGAALPLFRQIAKTPRGLVLIVGPTGSGKWTTACSIVDQVNQTKAARIFVVESHPNYRFESKQSMVTQLHIGQDCDSYGRALDIAHQADLDLVALDDIPTAEVLRQALILAETGHLVIANLHAEGAVDAIQRLVEAAGPDAEALRRSLTLNLVAVTGQRLLPGTGGRGRVPAYEWIRNTPGFWEALLTGDPEKLRGLQSTDPECRTLNAALDELVETGQVEPDTAAPYRIHASA